MPLYLITPWQYPPKLGMLFYILSRLGSIQVYLDLACCVMPLSYHALAVSAKSWNAILDLIKSWQFPLKYKPAKTRATKAQVEKTNQDCESPNQKPKLWKLKLNKQRHPGVLECEVPCGHAEEVVDFASGRGYLIGWRRKFAKKFLPIFLQIWYNLCCTRRY